MDVNGLINLVIMLTALDTILASRQMLHLGETSAKRQTGIDQERTDCLYREEQSSIIDLCQSERSCG